MRKNCTDDPKAVADVLDRAEVIWLALVDDQGPHCVPVNFALDGETIYIHSGKKGRKAAALDSGGVAAFSAAVDVAPKRGDDACSQGYFFRSVMGSGTVRACEGDEHKKGLDAITLKHTGKLLPYSQAALELTAVYAIDIAAATARIKDPT